MTTAGSKIIRGLEDALAYAKGDRSRCRVTIVKVPRISREDQAKMLNALKRGESLKREGER